jgi:hypothetical protein
MSLQLAAEHLARHGRGNDTELVHMDKGEVQALRGIAQARGGNLTTNPHTGLTEAGFLSSILPTIAGAAMVALAPETGGLSMLADPMMAGLIVGAGDYALTGSLSKGIMAGLGAWGGGSMISGLEGVGAQNLVQQGGDAGQAAYEAAKQEAIGNLGNQAMDASRGMVEPDIQGAAQNGLNAQNFPNMSPEQLQQMQQAIPKAANPADIYSAAGMGNASQAGASGLTKLGALNAGDVGSYAMGHLGQTAAVVMPPLLNSKFARSGTGTMPAQSQANNYGQPLQRISSNFQGNTTSPSSTHYQATYPNYVQAPYNPYTGSPATLSPGSTVYAADGGLMGSGPAQTDFMGGGDVYPMSQQQTPHYATPTQVPMGAQPINSGYEVKTNPLTGEEMPQMAAGGIARFSNQGKVLAQKPDIESPIVAEDDPTAAKMNAFDAAQYKYGKLGSSVGIPTASMPTGRVKGLGQVNSFKSAAQQDAEAKLAATQQAAAPTQTATDTIGMAAGGDTSHIYQPQYPNYQQTPFTPLSTMSPAQLQAAIQSYTQQGIPTPTRFSTAPTAGYALDPMTMQGSPAYNAEQERIAAEKAAQQSLMGQMMAASNNVGDYGGASGGLPRDFAYAAGGIANYAGGGQALGSYSDGGQMLKGPGDGMSDSIPAQIGKHQPARLADGEFVVPADVVSHLGNGSTDAGARKLYAMMDKIRKARTGKKKQAPQVKVDKYLPA